VNIDNQSKLFLNYKIEIWEEGEKVASGTDIAIKD
jgi:hypothetical protein